MYRITANSIYLLILCSLPTAPGAYQDSDGSVRCSAANGDVLIVAAAAVVVQYSSIRWTIVWVQSDVSLAALWRMSLAYAKLTFQFLYSEHLIYKQTLKYNFIFMNFFNFENIFILFLFELVKL